MLLLQEGILYVHRVHNKGGIFDVMLDMPLDIEDCRSVRVMCNRCNYVSVQLIQNTIFCDNMCQIIMKLITLTTTH